MRSTFSRDSANPLHPFEIRPERYAEIVGEPDVGPDRNPMRPVNIKRLAGQELARNLPRSCGPTSSHSESLRPQPRLSLLHGLLSPSMKNRSGPISYS